jgi:hypothetical protein
MIDNQNAQATYAILPALPRQAQDHPAWLPRQAQDKDIKRIWPTKEGVSRAVPCVSVGLTASFPNSATDDIFACAGQEHSKSIGRTAPVAPPATCLYVASHCPSYAQPPAYKKTVFFEVFLCLSRARLGKMFVFIYKWL